MCSFWPAALTCVLLGGCGNDANKQGATPNNSIETLEAKRAKIVEDLTAAEAKRNELIDGFVRDLLAEGQIPKSAVEAAAEEIGISSEEVADAAQRLGVVTVEGEGGPFWKLAKNRESD